jgi:hypothetical protein
MPESDDVFPAEADRCAAEIEALHRFVEDWLSGALPETDTAFGRVERALDPDFRLIHPSGAWRSRDDILEGLKREYVGQPDLAIQIRDVRLEETGEDLLLATYEEWQTAAEVGDRNHASSGSSTGNDSACSTNRARTS